MNDDKRLLITPDQSIYRLDGTALHYSCQQFIEEIVEGDTCFICGVKRKKTRFNDEHVIPKWLLRELDIYEDTIVMPNGDSKPYSQWTLPCCITCNSILGKAIEDPVSKLLKAGYSEVQDYVSKNGPSILFYWINLIFLKTYLKSMRFRIHADQRKGNATIGDTIDWSTMHHIHCIVRSIFTGAAIHSSVIGSFVMFPAKILGQYNTFDYVDLIDSKAILIQFKDIALFTILDDACGTLALMEGKKLTRISGPLSPLQMREVLARLAYTRSLIKKMPRFYTNVIDGMPYIKVEMDDIVEALPNVPARFGEIMFHLCDPILKKIGANKYQYQSERLREGKWTFLFDENDEFAHDSMDDAIQE